MFRLPRALSLIGSLGLAAAIALSAAPAARAADSVTIAVTGGDRTASIADLTLSAVNYSHAQQNQTGSMTLTADDSTGSGQGWNVTVQSSAFNHDSGGAPIPAANFSIDTPATPVATAGQARDDTNGPRAGAGGTLETARRVIYANASYGQGTYTQSLPVTLTVPAQARAGTYSASLTVTMAVGPGE
ncbi:MAG TPA: WxL domain-containing protein [Chloroflexaceae bacterium]|nr:WxL domain-containing protein [Chloroflexaceae bacterium]